jgi:hypothetical protein
MLNALQFFLSEQSSDVFKRGTAFILLLNLIHFFTLSFIILIQVKAAPRYTYGGAGRSGYIAPTKSRPRH